MPLKKLTFILFLFYVLGLEAQEKKLQLAFVATPQLSWINSNHALVDREGVRLGYSLGIQGDYFFSSNYAISSALLYSKSGGKLKYNAPILMDIGGVETAVNEGDAVLYNMAYVEIPIGLKLKTKEFWRSIFWGQAGISPMINISAEDKNRNDLSEETNWFNLGYHFGVGLDYSLGGSTFITGSLMLSRGLTDITSTYINGTNDKSTMDCVQLRLGIIF